jgi:hypothetical protein
MKSIHEENQNEYPCLMESTKNDVIVLFNEESQGMVVNTSCKQYKIGEYNDLWNMSVFTKLEGKVILEN